MFHLRVGLLTAISSFQNFHKAHLLCKAKIFFFFLSKSLKTNGTANLRGGKAAAPFALLEVVEVLD